MSPVQFLERAASAFPERLAIVDGNRSFTYFEFYERVQRLAGALNQLGIRVGDRVAALCANSNVMLELHNAVPWIGGVLVPLNIRLAVVDLAAILQHSGCRLIVVTEELEELANELTEIVSLPIIVSGDSDSSYEQALATSQPTVRRAVDELSLLAINYTSGSTGKPKGVMYNHRGAFLQSLAMAYHCQLDPDSAYLWTLPMFHCDGWCLTWAVTAAAGRHVCLRRFQAPEVWQIIQTGGITHLSAAPTVLTMIAEAAEVSGSGPLSESLLVTTGGAPPSSTLLARLNQLRFEVTHLYGLTESYGPAVVNQWQPQWSSLPEGVQATLNARQGIGNIVTAGLRVVDRNGIDVPNDGATIGEIVLRGGNVMMGYYCDEHSTKEAFIGDWLKTGDLAVRHPDRYIEIRDRAKDIIITGGENVASVEVESILAEHHAVLECAVVAAKDPRWGEVPVAFVTIREGHTCTEEDLIEFVRVRTTRFKVPKAIRFEELPKTATGKIQKHLLRQRIAGTKSEDI